MTRRPPERARATLGELASLARRGWLRISHPLFHAWRGRGLPVRKEVWEQQYEGGCWDRLHSLDEIGHYAVLAACVAQLSERPSILEVGCGSGRLLELLVGFGFASYHGLDLSAEAIRRSRSLGIENADFEVADFDQWTAPRRYDAIIFNEVLYYAPRPVDTLHRYARALSDAGELFVSMHRSANHALIWKKLERSFEVRAANSVQNSRGETWDVKVLRPTGA